MTDTGDRRIGKLAVQRRFISQEQLEQAVKAFEKSRVEGSELPFGEFLMEKGLIPRHQLEALLEAQGRADTKEFIPGYEFLKKLGEGGMGMVYMARQKSLDRHVAVKLLPSRLSKDKTFIERFMREARMAAKLDHAYIVRGMDAGEHEGHYYFVMEYVKGKSLQDMVGRGKAIDEKQALKVAHQITQALEFAHSKGIVHRDIKPSNILLTGDGTAKLCDMGLARQTEEETQMTMTGQMVGTPHYASPEQARGDRDLDTRTDIYSLGATLYRLVTGKVPFEGTSAAVVLTKHLTEQIPWPRELNPGVSDRCSHLIEKMMAREAGDRYQTPSELLKDIERVLKGKPPACDPLEPGKSSVASKHPSRARAAREREPEKKSMSPGLLWGLVAGGVVLAVIIAVMAGGKKKPPPIPPGPPVNVVAPKPEEKLPEKGSAQQMHEYVADWAKKHPEEYDRAIDKFELLAKRVEGTVWAMKAQDAARNLKAARDKAAKTAFAKLQEGAARHANAAHYDDAIAVYAALPAKFGEVMKPWAEAETAALRKKAESLIGAALRAAGAHGRNGDPVKGLAELDKLASVRYAAMAGKIAALRTRLEEQEAERVLQQKKEAGLAARKKVETVLAECDRKLLAGDYDGARTVLRRAERDEMLKAAAATLKQLGSILAEIDGLREAQKKAREKLEQLIGRKMTVHTRRASVEGVLRKIEPDALVLEVQIQVERAVAKMPKRIEFSELADADRARFAPSVDPSTDAGWLACAIIALAEKDAPAAEKALGKAAAHPWAARYRARLAAMKGEVKEALAMTYWQNQLRVYEGAAALTRTSAEKVKTSLDDFTNVHGATKFAGSKEKEIAALRERITKAIGVTVTEEMVKKLFNGNVFTFDEKTLEIEIRYGFANPHQTKDWTTDGGTWVIAGAGLTGKAQGDGLFWWNGHMDPQEMSIEANVGLSTPDAKCCFVVCGEGSGWSGQMGLVGWDGRGQVRVWEQANSHLAKGTYKKLPGNRRSTFSLARKGRQVTIVADGKPAATSDKASDVKGKRVAIGTQGGIARFYDVVVRGKLDRAWLEEALK